MADTRIPGSSRTIDLIRYGLLTLIALAMLALVTAGSYLMFRHTPVGGAPPGVPILPAQSAGSIPPPTLLPTSTVSTTTVVAPPAAGSSPTQSIGQGQTTTSTTVYTRYWPSTTTKGSP